MAKQYAVIGMGRFGSSIATSLYKQGNEVLAIDKNEQHIEEYKEEVTHAVIGDSTDEQTLKQIGRASCRERV